MSHEGYPTAAPEQVPTIDAYLVIQESLGVNEDVARDLASVRIVCPDPRGGGAEGSLGEFMATPHGIEQIEPVLAQTKEALKLGADLETALGFGLGAMAVKRDEAGKLVRVSKETEQVKKK